MRENTERLPRLGPGEASGGMREVFARFMRERGGIGGHRPVQLLQSVRERA
jgi:hypothetical protein